MGTKIKNAIERDMDRDMYNSGSPTSAGWEFSVFWRVRRILSRVGGSGEYRRSRFSIYSRLRSDLEDSGLPGRWGLSHTGYV